MGGGVWGYEGRIDRFWDGNARNGKLLMRRLLGGCRRWDEQEWRREVS